MRLSLDDEADQKLRLELTRGFILVPIKQGLRPFPAQEKP
jgi:hypothetical protein